MKEDGEGILGSKCIFRHDLGDDVIMNMVSSPNDLCTIAAGIGSSCQLLQIKNNGASLRAKRLLYPTSSVDYCAHKPLIVYVHEPLG